MDHPLKVYYPYGGRHWLLRWWTNDKGSKVIVAKTEASFLKTFVKIITLIDDTLRVESVKIVDIVAPHESFCKHAASLELQEKIDVFLSVVRSHLGKHLPDQFVKCDQWISRWAEGDYEPSDVELINHYCCKNCVDSFKLKTLSKEEFYFKYKDGWREIWPESQYVDKREQYSQAPLADPNRPLCVVSTRGHIVSNGLSFYQLEKDIPDHSISDRINPCTEHFYFHLVEELDSKIYQDMYDTIRTEQLKLYEEAKAEKKMIRERETQENLEKMLALFRK